MQRLTARMRHGIYKAPFQLWARAFPRAPGTYPLLIGGNYQPFNTLERDTDRANANPETN